MEAADQPPGQGLGGTVGGNLLDPGLKSTVRPSLPVLAVTIAYNCLSTASRRQPSRQVNFNGTRPAIPQLPPSLR